MTPGRSPLLREPPGHLRRARGLPRPLQAGEHDGLFFEREVGRLPDEVDHLLVDDLEDVVARGRAARRLLVERPFPNVAREVHHQVDVDVGLQQRALDLLHDVLDVLLVEPGFATEVVEGAPERASKVVEYHLLGVATADGKRFSVACVARLEGAPRYRERRV